jgi:formate hydrogenlyase subunit 6/NADH:ubiquinone oxidoreductase subunit I
LKFDVVALAGPRIPLWPSAGVKALSVLCGEMGLSVGLFGGEDLTVRGVIPLPGTGGMVLVEDVQHRIHRIHARAIVRVTAPSEFPDPFPGWRSEALLPLRTAIQLREKSKLQWDPCTVILGSGNPALRFGSALLESGAKEVLCIESNAQWGAKRFSGWEVEKRRFEMNGGKLIEAKPHSISPKAAMLWEMRLQTSQGVRVLEVARVVSAGPFRDTPGVLEYPPGSFLFEMEQTASAQYQIDVEGWVLEEERGRWLAGKIIRALLPDLRDLGERKDDLDRIFNRARGRLKRYYKHRFEPFTPSYQGKWIAVNDSKRIREFSGTPKEAQKERFIASIECFEEIPCRACQLACPEDAIQIGKVPRPTDIPVLTESKCQSCGICVSACPSNSVVLMKEEAEKSVSKLVLPWRGSRLWQVGEFASLLNRRGETLVSARITRVLKVSEKDEVQQVEVEVPTHLLWEARSLKPSKVPEVEQDSNLAAVRRLEALQSGEAGVSRVEVTFNGEKRIVRDRRPISIALYENGQSRPEDTLLCSDGSCGLCQIDVDGIKKLACKTEVHRGMVIKTPAKTIPAPGHPSQDASLVLCPCLGITQGQVLERISHGKLQSAEALLSVLHVGQGRCHGQICMGAFKRLLQAQGLEMDQWIDWRFPWSEWVLTHN